MMQDGDKLFVVKFSFEKAFSTMDKAVEFAQTLIEPSAKYNAEVRVKTYQARLDENEDPMLKKIKEEKYDPEAML